MGFPNVPHEKCIDTKIGTDADDIETIIELLMDHYDLYQTYRPHTLDPDTEAQIEGFTRTLYQLLSTGEDVTDISPISGREAFYFASTVASIVGSPVTLPGMEKTGQKIEDPTDQREIRDLLIDAADRYLTVNPAVRDLIRIHIDQFGEDATLTGTRIDKKDIRNAKAYTMAGIAFMLIENQNADYFMEQADNKVIKEFESRFYE
jgi:hypothetical protein